MFTVTEILPSNIAVLYLITGKCNELAGVIRTQPTLVLKRVFLTRIFRSPETSARNGMVCGDFGAVLWNPIFRIMSCVWKCFVSTQRK